MINTKLENLLLNSVFSDKDRYEIRQIFNFCSNDKKLNIINNFDIIIEKVKKIKQELKDSQTILLWKTISNIEKSILSAKTWGINRITQDSLNNFKEIFK